jgi:hypothetical protein
VRITGQIPPFSGEKNLLIVVVFDGGPWPRSPRGKKLENSIFGMHSALPSSLVHAFTCFFGA